MCSSLFAGAMAAERCNSRLKSSRDKFVAAARKLINQFSTKPSVTGTYGSQSPLDQQDTVTPLFMEPNLSQLRWRRTLGQTLEVPQLAMLPTDNVLRSARAIYGAGLP